MTRNPIIGVLVGLLAVWASPLVSADGLPQERAQVMSGHTWIAVSTSSMAITGNVQLTSASVTFDGRVTYKLRHLREIVQQAHPEWGWGRVTQFSLFEIVDPRIEPMINGNTLCGHPKYGYAVFPARYLAIGFEPGIFGYELLILTYRTETPPDINTDNGHCGGLGYAEERRPQP
jgi:hypothetical protein